MKKDVLFKISICLCITCIVLQFFTINNNSNSNMNLIFVGDCMFGRNGNAFTKEPFINVGALFKEATHIFLNLETTISNPLLSDDYKEDKVFNYQSNGEHLLSLKGVTN